MSVYMMTDPHRPGGPVDRRRLDRLLRTAAGKLDPAADVWGHLNRRTGACRVAPSADVFGASDLIDDLCELTLLRGGDVLEVDESRMPTAAPVAAILRY